MSVHSPFFDQKLKFPLILILDSDRRKRVIYVIKIIVNKKPIPVGVYLMSDEIKRNMILVGAQKVSDLNRDMLIPLDSLGDRILS